MELIGKVEAAVNQAEINPPPEELLKAQNLEKAQQIATGFVMTFKSMPKEVWGLISTPKSRRDLLTNKITVQKMLETI